MWKVGQLAKRTGISVRTLHPYDQIGLLTPSHRTESGHRLYDRDDVVRLQQIVMLRQLGFALEEIAAALRRAAAAHRSAPRPFARADRARAAAVRAARTDVGVAALGARSLDGRISQYDRGDDDVRKVHDRGAVGDAAQARRGRRAGADAAGAGGVAAPDRGSARGDGARHGRAFAARAGAGGACTSVPR